MPQTRLRGASKRIDRLVGGVDRVEGSSSAEARQRCVVLPPAKCRRDSARSRHHALLANDIHQFVWNLVSYRENERRLVSEKTIAERSAE